MTFRTALLGAPSYYAMEQREKMRLQEQRWAKELETDSSHRGKFYGDLING